MLMPILAITFRMPTPMALKESKKDQTTCSASRNAAQHHRLPSFTTCKGLSSNPVGSGPCIVPMLYYYPGKYDTSVLILRQEIKPSSLDVLLHDVLPGHCGWQLPRLMEGKE